jgi:putative FmdB family regulatory protein
MPIYEFKCLNCDGVFEKLCFPSDRMELVSCPSCGGQKTERLLSAFCSVSGGSEGGAGAGSSCSHSHSGGFS